MESLAEIMTRVERLAFAQEQEQSVSPPVLQLPSSAEQATLPLDLPPVEVSTSLEYIQAEAFLEVSGYFTPSSKRIKGIYTKEKKLREYLDEKGNKRTVKTKISANYELGFPITSDLDYYRAFLKICDEIVDRDGRFRMPITVPTSTIIRYAGKTENARVWREVREWFDRMTGTLIKGWVFRAKHRNYEFDCCVLPFLVSM